MDISRRVLFGAVAGGVVAARKLLATERVTKTEREVLVEKLMQPITWDGDEEGRSQMSRSAFYRDHFIEWSGWLGKSAPEVDRPEIAGHACGTWTATRPWPHWDRKDHVPAIVPRYRGDEGWDRTVDGMLDARRRTLDALLDLIEGSKPLTPAPASRHSRA